MISFDASQFAFMPPALSAQAGPLPRRVRELGRNVTDVSRRRVSEVIVGDAVYSLRTPVTLTFYPYVQGAFGELFPEPSSSDIAELDLVGLGTTLDEAYNDWAQHLHTRVQTLLSKLQWEMTAEELQEMAAFERLIDVPAYHRDTPYRQRQIGRVGSTKHSRNLLDKIRWDDGSTERVTLAQMPPEFASLKPGQRFEAICVRNSADGSLLHVAFVNPLPPLPNAPANDQEWDALPKSSEAPKVSWRRFK